MTDRKVLICEWDARPEEYYAVLNYSEAVDKKKAILLLGSKPLRLLHNVKIRYKYKQHCMSSLPLKWLWYPFYQLDMHLKKNEKYILLFNQGHPCIYNPTFFIYLHQRYDVKIVLVLRNMFENKQKPKIKETEIYLSDFNKYFDLVITNEFQDSELFNLIYMPNPFTRFIVDEGLEPSYDLCFSGTDKGRLPMLKEIAHQAKEKGVICDFRVLGNSEDNKTKIQFVDWQPYPDLIKQNLDSNCILEILQPDQDGYTLRMQEAICYNKKLLTNNIRVKESKFYNPKYIQYFKNIEDINFDFIKERIKVDYHYNDEYSPCAFIEKIKQLLEEKT